MCWPSIIKTFVTGCKLQYKRNKPHSFTYTQCVCALLSLKSVFKSDSLYPQCTVWKNVHILHSCLNAYQQMSSTLKRSHDALQQAQTVMILDDTDQSFCPIYISNSDKNPKSSVVFSVGREFCGKVNFLVHPYYTFAYNILVSMWVFMPAVSVDANSYISQNASYRRCVRANLITCQSLVRAVILVIQNLHMFTVG